MHRRLLFTLIVVYAASNAALAADLQIEYVDAKIAMHEPIAPIQPEEADLPDREVDLDAAEGIGSAWGGVSLRELPTELAASPVASVVSGDESALRGTTDVGDLLEQSGDTGNVMLFTRSPVSNQPRIRGYRYAQICNTVDGAYFFPIRPDLDSVLSRIDSSLIEDVSVIDGPYAVRYGPGFAFINVQMKRTERNPCGTGTQARTATSYDTNGEAWYGLQTFHAGGDNFGYRVSYVHRTGSDYRAGDDFLVAASHNARTLNCALGYDPSPNSTFEFNYIRNDLTDVDLPAQVTDLTFLVSDAFQVRYELENQSLYDELAINLWYNTGHFLGDNVNKVLGDPFSQQRDNLTWGRNYSTGGRVLATWGNADDGQLAAGADLLVERQQYMEFEGRFYYGIPKAVSVDTGLFCDGVVPWSDSLNLKCGGRVDWLHVDSDGTAINESTGQAIEPDGRIQNFNLFAAYLIGEYELSEELTSMIGYGLAQRPPTPTDLFSSKPFLSILQQGPFFFAIGQPELDPEMVQQIDVGVTADYEDFRGGIRGFYSWIDDFITYVNGPDVSGDRPHTVNRDARLLGGEAYGDLVLTPRLTYFANMSYVEGTDWSSRFITDPIFKEPLWGIPPFQAVTGMRWTDPSGGKTWGIEYQVRFVGNQNRANVTVFTPQPSYSDQPEQPTPGFTTHDLRGYWNVSDAITFVAAVENFGNRNYQEHLDSRIDTNYNHPGGVFRRGRNFYFLVQGNY